MKILINLLIAFFFTGGQAVAKEDVCSRQSGEAYALCQSFCEDMDCDSNDMEASRVACGKIYVKFMTLTGLAPPCEGYDKCIEWSDAQLKNIGSHSLSSRYDDYVITGFWKGCNFKSVSDIEYSNTSNINYRIFATTFDCNMDYKFGDDFIAGYLESDSRGNNVVNTTTYISQEEFELCKAEIEAHSM